MNKRLAIVLIGILFLSGCKENESQEETTVEYYEGVYVPKDLNDCFVELVKILSPEDINNMKVSTEDDIIGYHFSLGIWMRNNWGLWQGSRLSKWFNKKGIYHPDDMTGIILTSFHRHLKDKNIKLEEQIEYYVKYWEEMEG